MDRGDGDNVRHAAVKVSPPALVRLLLDDRFLLGMLLLAFVVRALVLLVPVEQTSDFLWYFHRAAGIARGEGYHQNGVPTAFWPVGWPGGLALALWMGGITPLSGQIANLAMGVAACLLTAVVGEKLLNDRAAGRLAALAIAVYPNQIGYVPLLSAEIFFQVLLLAAVWLVARGRPWQLALAGLLFGVATLTKTQALVLPGFLLGWMLVAQFSRAALWRSIRAGCIVYVCLLAVVAPWTFRNWTVFGALVPVSTNGGWTLLTGNNPQAAGDYTPETVLAEGISHNPEEQIAMDRLARARAIDWIRANPSRFLQLIPLKAFRLWAPDGESEWFYQAGSPIYDANWAIFRAVRVANQGYYLVLLGLAVPSIWLVLRRRGGAGAWGHAGIALCVAFTLISVVFSGQSRFHFSLMPFVAMYAALTVMRLVRRRTGGIGAAAST